MTDTERFPDVMLLAAGLGTRLRPITDTLPKPLVPVAGIPLIERIMRNAQAEGARRFVANAHYRADQVLAHFGGLVKVSREEELLGIGGGIKRALPMLHSDPVLVLNTDAFWPAGADRPFGRMVARFARGGADIVMLCVHPRNAVGFGRSHDFCLAPDGAITNDYGAPVIYGGAMLLRHSLFDHTPDGPFPVSLVIDRARAAETVFGIALDAPWYHIGDPEALAEAERQLAS